MELNIYGNNEKMILRGGIIVVTGRDDLKEYKIMMTNRRHTVIEGVENVENFDDHEILLNTKMGLLILKGQDLHIVQLNLDEGTLVVDGLCKSLDFADDRTANGLKGRSKGFIQRILK
ncbi:MAG: sporulation protein YabP [Thermincola sp.]|jgi:sporulation protein YabP|nr:sporulation protein YabP [Thermincola sp.]